MKVARTEQTFRPITIVIESKNELIAITQAIAMSSPTEVEKEIRSKGQDIPVDTVHSILSLLFKSLIAYKDD